MKILIELWKTQANARQFTIKAFKQSELQNRDLMLEININKEIYCLSLNINVCFNYAMLFILLIFICYKENLVFGTN